LNVTVLENTFIAVLCPSWGPDMREERWDEEMDDFEGAVVGREIQIPSTDFLRPSA
jgi:hypothetical protein